MGRGIIGESGSDRAMNKMIKHLEKSDRQTEKNGGRKREDNSIIAQLKAVFGERWEEELDEMTLEHKNPEYLKAKNAAADAGKAAYYAQSRRDRDNANLTEGQFVRRYVNQWKADNRSKFQKR